MSVPSCHEDAMRLAEARHVVIDCTDAANAEFAQSVTFPVTPEGRAAAEGLFQAWVKDRMDPNDPYNDAEIDGFIEDGKCEIEQGYLAIDFALQRRD